MKRRAARVDANQAGIVAFLRRCGAGVTVISAVGNGCPDLLVSYAGRWMPAEVKDGSKPASGQRFTRDELLWAERQSARAYTITDESTALAMLDDMAGAR